MYKHKSYLTFSFTICPSIRLSRYFEHTICLAHGSLLPANLTKHNTAFILTVGFILVTNGRIISTTLLSYKHSTYADLAASSAML